MKKSVGKVKKEDLFVFDGKEKEYDIHPEMVKVLKEKMKEDGREIMREIISLSEKYEDRTLYFIKAVAEKTGVKFPHLLQAYVEIFLNAALEAEYYKVRESTRRCIKIEIVDCPKNGKWCEVCRDSVEEASAVLSIPAKLILERKEKMCTFRIDNPEYKG